MLETRGVVKSYRNRKVVNEVSIAVNRGEVVGLLGPNGAGKTTIFYVVVGLIRGEVGQVLLDGNDITRLPMYKRARLGIGYLPQETSIFRKLTVEENIKIIWELIPVVPKEKQKQRLDELLEEMGIVYLRKNKGYELSGGEKRRVEIVRALATEPSFILLDEPFAGIDPIAVNDIQEIIRQLKSKGLGVLITDHNVRETLSITDRAYILHEGKILSSGSSEYLTNDPVARQFYLGDRFSM
ncbi:MAG: LPS export ABC transporter ATP-binding protein [Candidatus Margulisiibacteriota bacterium]|nr:MAG: LPS export ABC transporter ATP-binding protein [Candidatus Margulisbacteria bacterium GWD2_39_127]OGI01671.1 MAG: LPS export ABC transporter ATP-binding protein [Candidatus Margulisbacteria bacterium GWF2_38_17]OGI05854.1 MAG: LPS export ABC transporter ATP-binding protein [Candidatus Margulisbacteria bacterium GWE2_39_32]PZM81854.1 MAG: LPS export ABC transporter ATP-binding protein [Candidatus Margulisiibacteriota bacterium]HAR63111.1 LPS export ABC transporter ATP-binding protein [Ca